MLTQYLTEIGQRFSEFAAKAVAVKTIRIWRSELDIFLEKTDKNTSILLVKIAQNN
jgi:hypothetical protein